MRRTNQPHGLERRGKPVVLPLVALGLALVLWGKDYVAAHSGEFTNRKPEANGEGPSDAATLHITDAQESQLLDLLESAGISLKTFLTFGKLTTLAKLPADRLDGAKAWIAKNKVAK